VRNRVALKAARMRAAAMSKLVRLSVVLAVVPAVLVTGAQIAAADDRAAVDSASVGLAGPVGIAAVVLGFGGLVAGLLRHRRREVGMSVRQRVDPRERA